MALEWPIVRVDELQAQGKLLVEDGNHGEYRPLPHEFASGATAFIRAANMGNGRVLFDSADRITDVALARIRKGVGKGGDILFSHKGTVGKVALVPFGSPPFVCSPQTTFWRVVDPRTLDRQFLYAFMRSDDFIEQWRARKGETDMADYVSLTAQREFRVPVPPIKEQEAIGRVIGGLDDKIALTYQMNRTLEAMADSLFKAWFVDFDPIMAKAERRAPGLREELADLFPDRFVDTKQGVLPAGWRVGIVGEHLKNFDSRRVPVSGAERAKRHGPFPYHGAAGVMDHVDSYLFDGVYVLVGEDGSVMQENSMAVTQYVWGKFWVNNHAHVLQGNGSVSTEQLYLYFRSESVAPFVTGAVQPKLSQGRMNGMPFVFSGDAVCSAFGDVVLPLFRQLRANSDENKVLSVLRDALLGKLLSGHIRAREAEELARQAGA